MRAVTLLVILDTLPNTFQDPDPVLLYNPSAVDSYLQKEACALFSPVQLPLLSPAKYLTPTPP